MQTVVAALLDDSAVRITLASCGPDAMCLRQVSPEVLDGSTAFLT